MAREFEIRRDVELPATPEEVWDAVATNAGVAAWLFPSGGDPEPRVGGKAADGSTVQAWDPPNHFAVRYEGEDGFFNAVEFVIEGRGGTTVLRYAHSGIITDDWDNQYDAANQHTDFYLHTLGQYLAHFSGRTATYVGEVPGGINGPEASAQPGAFDTLRAALGVGGGVAEGDAVRLEPDGVEAIDGVVDYVRPNFLGIRTADALYRFFGRNAFGMPVGMQIHAFADGVDKDATQAQWQAWLNGVYA
jgi:uncharacterized protein YndB with AHSA1/START domain